MSQNDSLQDRFPDMTPVTAAPSLYTMNGIGTTVYGDRDRDAETGTYVKTLCLVVLFVPILCLRAYRVADAPQGWYFIGRVPLSGLAHAWNLIATLAITGGIGYGVWHHHTSSPEYQADRMMAEADQKTGDGQLGDAADLYRKVALSGTDRAGAADAKLSGLIDHKDADAAELARALKAAADLTRAGRAVPDLYERGKALALARAEQDPGAALALIDSVAPLAKDQKEVAALRLPLLERAVALKPDNLDLVSELALVYETRQDLDRAVKLLEPHAQKLGDREGARILGQIYVGQGKLDEAYGLLAPYAEDRLKRYQGSEQRWRDALKKADDEMLAELNARTAPGFDYDRYKASDKAAQERMVSEYLDSRLRDHPTVKAALSEIERDSKIVPVALDLGMVQLQRAQGMADPAARKRELEKAEKTFLAVRATAGQSDEYRLNLGQVYYWLGKQAEGRKLFDEVLAAKARSADALGLVAKSLRQVGAAGEAKTLTEEAYQKETDAKKKYQLANLRAAMAQDVDDRALWLGKANPDDPVTRTALLSARGQQALQAGKDEEAAGLLRQAIAGHEGMAENYVSLNNCALDYLTLYGATGDRAALAKSNALLERAMGQRPDDTILIHNTADQLLAASLGEVVGDRIDLPRLREVGGFQFLSFLYNDEAGRKKVMAQVRDHPGIAKARGYYERVLLLAPQRPGTYQSLMTLLRTTGDKAALRDLSRRVAEVNLDLAERNKQTLDDYQGKNDAKLRKDLASMTARYEREVKAAREVGGATLGVSVLGLMAARLVADRLGEGGDPNELVNLAEEAHTAAPSYGSRTVLTSCLLYRAHRDLIKQAPAYVTLAERGKRSLGPVYVAAVALVDDGPAQKACLAHPDVQRTIGLLKEEVDRSGGRGSEWTWAMLRAAAPDHAAKVAASLKKNEQDAAERAIQRTLSPLAADQVYRQAWSHRIAGRETEAAAVLRRATEQGVPLPGAGS